MRLLVESSGPILYADEEGASQALTSSAPIEETSPLGYNVNFSNATLVNISAMMGMGIFSTPSFVLRSVGSVGMLIALYLFVPLITLAGLSVYIEFASMCGHKRSGAEVVYLEEAYPKPKFLLPTTFALTTALLSHVGVSATVFAKHILHGFDIEVTPIRQRSLAISMATVAIWVCLFSNKWALRVNGVAAVFKIGCLVLISVTGLACLFGWTSVPNSGNLRHPFEGSLYEANPFATSVVKVLYSFVGWNSVLGLVAEVKGRHPVRTIQRAAITSVLVTAFFFVTTLLSFSIVLTKEEFLNANEVLGAIFVRKVYGDTAANKLFPIFIGISTFGGIVSGALYYGRMLREAGRQGVLPFATFWSRVGHFKTPYGPLLLKWSLAVFVIGVIPAADAVVFLIDLASYPALSIILLIMPWIPPTGGSKGGDVDFFYATYCIVAILILLLCGFYYWVRFCALPQWLGYELVQQITSLPGGVKIMIFKKVYKSRMEGEEEPLLQGRRGVEAR
ncbi:unnamed protein product [Rhizoctonia solani]|uniref:High-affinity methionine permease n=1 Tax=Rhizoctonia solani TaxID=456999 RepID=A0A8H3GTG3_9AGAM|nr:unnamed protein product [Rhizoctonia solani]